LLPVFAVFDISLRLKPTIYLNLVFVRYISKGAASQQTVADAQSVSIEILGEYPGTVPGKVKQITDRSMHLFVTHLVYPNSRVRVVFPNNYSVEGEVVFRNPSGDGFTIGVFFEGYAVRELRSEARVSIQNEKALVSILEGGTGTKIHAVVVDTSPKGLGLRIGQAIPSGAWIKVELRHTLVIGEVRHCSLGSKGDYSVGIMTETSIDRPQEDRPGTGLGLMHFFRKALKKVQADP
jgi:hypothetical protein